MRLNDVRSEQFFLSSKLNWRKLILNYRSFERWKPLAIKLEILCLFGISHPTKNSVLTEDREPMCNIVTGSTAARNVWRVAIFSDFSGSSFNGWWGRLVRLGIQPEWFRLHLDRWIGKYQATVKQTSSFELISHLNHAKNFKWNALNLS